MIFSRRRLLTLATAVPAAAALTPAADAAPSRSILFRRWTTTSQFTGGTHAGTRARDGALTWAAATSTRTYSDPYGAGKNTYDVATWTSPAVSTAFGLTELILSWHAVTPSGTFVEFQTQGVTTSGATSRWYSMGRWAHWDSSARIKRTSVRGQQDAYASVLTDTLRTRNGSRFARYRLRVLLHRRRGSSSAPSVRMLGAVATRLPSDATVTTSRPGVARGITLPVPTYSQMIHDGHYPGYDGGGEAWCSATSVAMVLDHFRIGPSASTMSWLPATHPDRVVDHAARMTYDYAYQGCGNWSFNVAYANHEGAADAFVTRLRSLAEAELFIKAGIPLIVSTSFRSGQLTGAGYGTNGHLMVIVGFTASGDVVVNDPASHLKKSNAQVRTTYRRGQFENAWIPKSGGLAYVIAPAGRALPTPPVAGSW